MIIRRLSFRKNYNTPMKFKKLALAMMFATASFMAFGQEVQVTEIVQEEAAPFKPYWFIQPQFGMGSTVGEAKVKDLIAPAAALNVGFKFIPALGVRIGASGWEAKGCWVTPKQVYSFKYIQANLDLLLDLSNMFCGYNPDRIFNGYLFGGVGLTHGFDNKGAERLDTHGFPLVYLWKGSKNFAAGRFGAGCDFRVSKRVGINLEANANILSDKFNSKKAGNVDWQMNLLAGVTVRLGKIPAKPAPVVQEVITVVEPAPAIVVVEEPAPAPAPVVVPPTMREDIFFALNSSVITAEQSAKLDELVKFLNNNPTLKVSCVGYADKDTGTGPYNMKLSERRVATVAKALESKGIAADRILTAAKGDTVQPFPVDAENRVCICIAE